MLQSVLAARKSLVLASQVVPSDYSGIRSPESSHPHGGRRSLLWADLGDRRELVFDFTPGRGADRPRAILLDDRGHLQVDAHSGHNAVSTEGRITQIDRRAHARRCFFDASGSDQENATHALALIARPHAIEREAKQHGLRALKPRVPPKSPLGQASGYALRPWDPPIRNFQDGRLETDDCCAERTGAGCRRRSRGLDVRRHRRRRPMCRHNLVGEQLRSARDRAMVPLQGRAPAPRRGRWPAAAHVAVPKGCSRSVGDLLIAAAATRSRSGAA